MSFLVIDFEAIEEFKTSQDGELIYYNSVDEKVSSIPEFNRINIFVGQNNSGKSRFIRGILKSENYHLSTFDNVNLMRVINEKIRELIKLVTSEPDGYYEINGNPLWYPTLRRNGFRALQMESVLSTLESIALQIKEDFLISRVVLSESEIIKTFGAFIKFLSESSSLNHRHPINVYDFNFIPSFPLISVAKKYKGLISDIDGLFSNILSGSFEKQAPNRKIFIPTLRTTHSLYRGEVGLNTQRENSDIFQDSVSFNYTFTKDVTAKQKIVIHTGLNLYREINDASNGTDSEKDGHREFEEFIRLHFFQQYKTIQIWSMSKSDYKDQNIMVRLGAEKGKPIHLLGDGISTLINLLYPIFTAPDNTWLFIEEPELHLHPGMQRIFIDELINNDLIKRKNLKYFITTHSNHILDIGSNTEDVSIYKFSKVQENYHRIDNVKSKDISILSELGAQNSSVYLANCTLWVEGVTDRIYISKYLECYIQQKNKEKRELRWFGEDINYAFFLYGGSNIIQYFFKEKDTDVSQEQKDEIGKIQSRFLSNHILLIADKDKGKEKRHEMFKRQQSAIFLFETLKVREIENLLSVEFIKSFLNLISKSVSKEEIAKIKLNPEKLKAEPLGKYIVAEAQKAKINFPKSFAGSSGTVNAVSYKRTLAEVAYKNMTWDLMTKEARELAEKVYKFIESNNSVKVKSI